MGGRSYLACMLVMIDLFTLGRQKLKDSIYAYMKGTLDDKVSTQSHHRNRSTILHGAGAADQTGIIILTHS